MRRAITAALLALLAGLAMAAKAQGATFLVTGFGDDIEPPACTEIQPGTFQCTMLRAAVNEAGNTSEADTIGLSVGTYRLTAGELALSGGVSIGGGGARQTTIIASQGNRAFSVLGGDAQLSALAVQGGAPVSGDGGNILVGGGATLTLTLARVTGGVAARGGGIANFGSLAVQFSVIDGNQAPTGSAIYNGGSSDGRAQLTILDSTLAANLDGAAIRSDGSPQNTVELTHTTIGRNLGGGLSLGTPQAATVNASILASNGSANCGPNLVSSATASVESGTDCGLTGSANRQGVDPQLATALSDAGGETNVLTIPADSVAVDLVNPCQFPYDQRLQPRIETAGAPCDAGAYEQAAAGGTAQPPVETPVPTPTPTPPPTVTPTPEPTPVVDKTVVVKPVEGRIRIRMPGSNRFVELDGSQGIPTGSTIDARDGKVQLSSVPKAGRPAQTALFYDGIFKVTQKKGLTDLALTEKLAPCGKRGARAAAKKVKRRKLWGDGKGAFRTTGRYSAATVRGTKWLVQDSCTGTLTRVAQGAVTVRDNVRKRTKVVRAGKKYLARPKR
jgi:hypothetical protein